uniref:Uncharacterized protein n=1 Tax=virus sp. ctML55 TaxID=2827627 RepID=A0A8S5RJA0_9VIRU|nr:MAG TPA: hypothetical protein [virus sp. ctML55]DAV60014.1 MAG TPA: hypothetical protein [Caudoviricetes sp.]DAW92034.1 MAG TPA: hypothetical protein [Bacteriophage sp.]
MLSSCFLRRFSSCSLLYFFFSNFLNSNIRSFY